METADGFFVPSHILNHPNYEKFREHANKLYQMRLENESLREENYNTYNRKRSAAIIGGASALAVEAASGVLLSKLLKRKRNNVINKKHLRR